MSAASPNDPFCNSCGYSFVGLTESARCPECGRPVVEVLTRGSVVRSVRWESTQKLFGHPLVAIARGPMAGERSGHARGIIAIGDSATGVIAIGLHSTGLIALGTFARGGLAIGPIAVGGVAIGSITVGIAALGAVAIGLFSVGAIAVGYVTAGAMNLYLSRGYGGVRVWMGRWLPF